MTSEKPLKIGVLTSGGDAPGMNAAVRAVVRTGLKEGAEMYLIYEGYQGMIDGGDGIRKADWSSPRGILNQGGTMIGTFRSQDFRTHEGRLKAAKNLIEHGIDRLVVIGGDGSLTGINTFRQEWPTLLEELVATYQISKDDAAEHEGLIVVGMVGSIDNDLVGVDSTIGADTALHRILYAVDALTSTAASHQRSFVLEVMGRHCGYLALTAAISGGCDYVLIPENPPAPGWEDEMIASLRTARERGRRDSIVIVAEGATDQQGNPITSEYVRSLIESTMHEATRTTILGHVQRGGTPSAYDRWASTWLGYEAIQEVIRATPGEPSKVVGILGNAVVRVDLMEAVQATQAVPQLIAEGRYREAMDARGPAFNEMAQIFREMSAPAQFSPPEDAPRIAILHAGGLAPGMNIAAQAAVRLGISRGFRMMGVYNGFKGLRRGDIRELGWDDVEGWSGIGGAELGIRRDVPSTEDLYPISRALEDAHIDGLLVIGGWNAYQAAHNMHLDRGRYPAFNIPIIAIPASIDNNLPGTELSIGTDTALNTNAMVLDQIKMSGSATTRCFIVETMGRYCGFLALMSGLLGGAERIYLNETGITIDDLSRDVDWVLETFNQGRRLFLAVTNEEASGSFNTAFLAQLLEGCSRDQFDVRTHVIGHVQQGSEPTPADRLLATRIVSAALHTIAGELENHTARSWFMGLQNSAIVATPMGRIDEYVDTQRRRPLDQWWMQLIKVAEAMAEEPGDIS